MTEKLYIKNPYLKEVRANIINKTFEGENVLLKLDKTIFFPDMSGGQPRDFGTINDKKVLNTYEEGSDIIHVLEGDIKDTNVELSIDWEHRFDQMQQHTGQHILSSTFETLLNAKTIGFHMGKSYITVDIEAIDVDERDILQAEILSNKIIQSNFKVINKLLDSDKANEYDLSKLPDGKEAIRIVKIDSISESACCGTHVSNTGEIGMIKILNAVSYKGNTRVSFICGNRALKDYSSKNKDIQTIAISLSANVSNVLEKFLTLKEDRDDLKIENKALREKITSLKGENLFEKKKNIGNIGYIIENLGDADKKELDFISSYLYKKDNLIQIYKLEDDTQGMFLICKSHNLDIDLKELFDSISQKIIVKGGGNNNKVQGITSLTIIDRVIQIFYDSIKDHFKTLKD